MYANHFHNFICTIFSSLNGKWHNKSSNPMQLSPVSIFRQLLPLFCYIVTIQIAIKPHSSTEIAVPATGIIRKRQEIRPFIAIFDMIFSKFTSNTNYLSSISAHTCLHKCTKIIVWILRRNHKTMFLWEKLRCSGGFSVLIFSVFRLIQCDFAIVTKFEVSYLVAEQLPHSIAQLHNFTRLFF